jgi:hypothetical protein
LWIILGTILALSAAAAVVVILSSDVRLRGGHMSRFRSSSRDRNAEKDAHESQEAPVQEAAVQEEQPARAADVSTHISSVLSAAEEAAVLIQEEARQEADRVRQHAQRQAAASVEAAREDAEAARVQAERLRFEAGELNQQARAAAEKHVAERLAEVEAQAREILSAAERQAASSREDEERRRQALTEDVSLAENRLRQLSTGLHGLAARLDDLLSTPLETEASDVPVREDDAIVDALGPSRKIEEATM